MLEVDVVLYWKRVVGSWNLYRRVCMYVLEGVL